MIKWYNDDGDNDDDGGDDDDTYDTYDTPSQQITWSNGNNINHSLLWC